MKRLQCFVFIFILTPMVAWAQFGPKKRDLQARIDTLQMDFDSIKTDVGQLKLYDSAFANQMKHLSNELKDLNTLVLDLNKELGTTRSNFKSIIEENTALKQQLELLKKEVEKQQILIKDVIGTDTVVVDEEAAPINHEITIITPGFNFEQFAKKFLADIKLNGEAALTEYMPQEGLFYYLSKPGFITSVAEIQNINELKEEIPWRVGLDTYRKSRFSFIEGEKPVVNCEMASLYNKQGIYGGLEENFNRVSKALDALKEFSPDEVSELHKRIKHIQENEQAVVAYIFSTDGNLGFYFIKQNGVWKLFCLEVDDPCSA